VSQPPQPWTLAYLPLRPRSLAVQLGILVLAEIALYFSYADHDARFHWATHFLVALGFTALLLLGRLLVTGAPGPRYLLLTLLGFHLYAMAPDLLFRGGSRITDGWTCSWATLLRTTCRAATSVGC